jgi:hypothetical protein
MHLILPYASNLTPSTPAQFGHFRAVRNLDSSFGPHHIDIFIVSLAVFNGSRRISLRSHPSTFALNWACFVNGIMGGSD